jgi:hypothetical protein
VGSCRSRRLPRQFHRHAKIIQTQEQCKRIDRRLSAKRLTVLILRELFHSRRMATEGMDWMALLH